MKMYRRISGQLGFLMLLIVFVVSTADVKATAIPVHDECSLSDAIEAANMDRPVGGCPAGSGADTLVLTNDITLAAELPHIESEITIEGDGQHISGDLSYRIFSVGDTKFTVNDVTLKDGRSDSGSAIHTYLGATITVNRSIIRNNIAHGSYRDLGGAILCEPCTLTINSSILSANTTSGYGGAIYYLNVDANQSLRIYNSTFEKNHAKDGAGLLIAGRESAHASFISNSTFYDNWASGCGGAIFHGGSETGVELFIRDSTFHRNRARTGGALYMLLITP